MDLVKEINKCRVSLPIRVMVLQVKDRTTTSSKLDKMKGDNPRKERPNKDKLRKDKI